jgi:hypothetical protein
MTALRASPWVFFDSGIILWKSIFISLSHWERVGVGLRADVNPNSFFFVECHFPAQRTRKIRSAHKPSSPALLPEGEGRKGGIEGIALSAFETKSQAGSRS